MGYHDCRYNCGASDCPAPTRITQTLKTDVVYRVDKFGFIYQIPIKEAAIEEIKEQPFYK